MREQITRERERREEGVRDIQGESGRREGRERERRERGGRVSE